jgi:hypothetical protein
MEPASLAACTLGWLRFTVQFILAAFDLYRRNLFEPPVLLPISTGNKMTRRERKDMKWIVAAFTATILVIVAGMAGGWGQRTGVISTAAEASRK